MSSLFFRLEFDGLARILRLTSPDGINCLTRACVLVLTVALAEMKDELKKQRPLRMRFLRPCCG